MSDFGNIIKRGRAASNTADQETGKPALRKANKKVSKPALRKASKPAKKSEDDPTVSLTIKVPKSLRKHWTIAAKQNDTSVAAAIVEALSVRFGRPESW
ncbi:MAG: hypothetical protein AAFX40_08845 [Cyanobacteria bacterium J06639_1]